MSKSRQVDGAHPGFHSGELAVQRLAGVEAEASRLVGMLDPADLHGAANFVLAQRFAVMTARDRAGRMWVSPLAGPEGFLRVDDARTLRVNAAPLTADPLHGLAVEQPVGLLVIDVARRRRFRVNGNLAYASDGALVIVADQAYGNCPQYIQQRVLVPAPAELPDALRSVPDSTGSLTDGEVEQIRAADTLFLGTTHPERGTDASHRGGPPGFVRVEGDRQLWWPDYPGNNMFNSLGNLAIDPTAALLFCDFASGRTLHLSGTATLELTAPGAPGDDGGTGRRVRFTVEQARPGADLPVRAEVSTPYLRHPAITD